MAQLLELTDAEGRLERPLIADEWFAPGSSLTVRDGHLELDWRAYFASLTTVRAGSPMLEAFVRLSASAPKAERAVLVYARRWGTLDLCEHQLAQGHGPVQVPFAFATTGAAEVTFEPPDSCRSLIGKEPVATWLYWSRQAGALLGVLSRLRRSEPALTDDWSVLCEGAPWVDLVPATEGFVALRELARVWTDRLLEGDVPLDTQQAVASGAVETWLRLAGVALKLRWSNGVPEIAFQVGGLLGALGLQILLAAVDSSGWLICPGCGTFHAPAQARHRRRSYCDRCRADNVPQRQASRRSRVKRSADPAYREAERARVRDWRSRTAAAATGADS